MQWNSKTNTSCKFARERERRKKVCKCHVFCCSYLVRLGSFWIEGQLLQHKNHNGQLLAVARAEGKGKRLGWLAFSWHWFMQWLFWRKKKKSWGVTVILIQTNSSRRCSTSMPYVPPDAQQVRSLTPTHFPFHFHFHLPFPFSYNAWSLNQIYTWQQGVLSIINIYIYTHQENINSTGNEFSLSGSIEFAIQFELQRSRFY